MFASMRKAMRNHFLLIATIVTLMIPRAVSAQSCESLSTLKLPDATITTATSVAAGAFAPPTRGGRGGAGFSDLPAFCRVEATLKPSADSDIKVEYWLPAAAAWNGKFQSTGHGGREGNNGHKRAGAGPAR